VSAFSEGLAAVKRGGKWGYIRPDGSVAIDFQFDTAREFTGRIARVEIDEMIGYIDAEGRYIWKPSN